jgi:hypothetical protein
LPPHAVLSLLPAAQAPDEQQPPLHATLALHAPVHLLALQAWSVGQSADVAQPQLPDTQWLVPVHGPHAVPPLPQVVSVVIVTHTPVESQQPVGQLVGPHVSTHCPEVHACATVHVWQVRPPVPQLADDSSVWHWPSPPQQPFAHVEAPHDTVVSPGPSLAPVSMAPASPVGPPSPPVSGPCVASPPSPLPPPSDVTPVVSSPASAGLGTSPIPQMAPHAPRDRASPARAARRPAVAARLIKTPPSRAAHRSPVPRRA